MARCSDCNKFVAMVASDYTDTDTSVEASEDGGSILVEARGCVSCEECGTDLLAGSCEIDVDLDGEDEFFAQHKAHRDKKIAEADGDEFGDDVPAAEPDVEAEAEMEGSLDEFEVPRTGKSGKPLKPKKEKALVLRGWVEWRCTCGCGAQGDREIESHIMLSEMEEA